MHISRLFIKNFRSIKELDISFSKGKNVIVGRNNSGKSNIIKAIDLVLGEKSPIYAKYENISEIDFYTYKETVNEGSKQIKKEKRAKEIFIYCELTREQGEALNYDELYNIKGLQRYNTRIRAKELSSNFTAAFDVNPDELVYRVEKTYIDAKLRNQKKWEAELDDKYSFAFAFRAKIDDDDKITKDIRFFYRESSSQDWFMAFTASIRNELIQSAIIPSFRDPTNQLRLSTWTWYGKLIKHLTATSTKTKDLLLAFEKVKDIGDKIFEEAKAGIQAGSLDVSFPNTEIYLQFNADVKADIYKNCVIYVDDGFKSELTAKGSGIQSATIIGLFNYYVKKVAVRTAALLCIEEPELYLHPHARRVISDRLDDFLDEDKNQVILTTHSSEFVRTTKQDLNIISVKNSLDTGTTANPINVKNYKHLLLDNNQNEIFFADKVIISEGYDHYILQWIAKEKFPEQLDSNNVSIISVGGKDNIAKLAKMVLEMGIECYIFADFDYFLRDRDEKAKKYGTKLHESVQSLGLKFFKQHCIFGNNGENVFLALQKSRTNIKKKEEEKFYITKSIKDFKNTNIDDKKLSAELTQLQQAGVCILSGEIEDFSKDKSINSSNNKLTLDKVFEISARLENGEKISDIFDISEMVILLKKVLNK